MSVLENIKKQLNVSNLYLILFFLYSLRIFGIQDEILWVWAVIGILYFVVRQKKLLLGFQGVILCVITPVYALVYKYYFTEIRGYTWKDAIYMIFLPVFMYILSRQFAYKKKEKMLELGLWCIAAGTFFYSLLNHWMYLKYGFPWGGPYIGGILERRRHLCHGIQLLGCLYHSPGRIWNLLSAAQGMGKRNRCVGRRHHWKYY